MSDEFPARPEAPLPLAISDCLLGAPVRFDGGHKKSAYPHAELDDLFSYTGLCPEVAIGLGTPRQPIRLVGAVANPAAVATRADVTGAQPDHTAALAAYAARVSPVLARVVGYVFMKNSPSCGLFRVKVYGSGGMPEAAGRGIYAAAVTAHMPALPVEESGRLHDPVLRENFVCRTFVYAHWQRLCELGLTPARLIEFHSRYKYLVMAHSVPGYAALGRLLSDLSADFAGRAQTYLQQLMAALRQPASRGGHANVLAHLQGYVKRDLPAADRQELARLIEDYRAGHIPLLAPLTLLQHHLQRHADDYALRQIYLDPHPVTAGLRRQL